MPRKRETNQRRTDFQLHINWKLTRYNNVVDFTEKRLLILARLETNGYAKSKLLELLAAYKCNEIAIAWQDGGPLWTRINKENY